MGLLRCRTQHVQAFNNYNNFLYGVPGGAERNALSFSLQNALEMKVRDDKDTTGTNPFRKVEPVPQPRLQYRLRLRRPPSFKLSTATLTFSTQLAKKLTLNSNASFDPYQRDSLPGNRPQSTSTCSRLTTAAWLACSRPASRPTTPSTPPRARKKGVVRRPVAPSNDPSLGAVGPPQLLRRLRRLRHSLGVEHVVLGQLYHQFGAA